MDRITYIALEKELSEALCKGRLGSAIAALRSMAECLMCMQFNDDLTEIEQGYSFLLDYYKRGVEDPERTSHIQRFLRQALLIKSQLHRLYLIEEGTTHFAVVQKTVSRLNMPTALSEMCKADVSPRWWFEVAWTGEVWTASDCDLMTEWVEKNTDEITSLLLISGATLSLIYQYDPNRMQFLIQQLRSPRTAVRARALVGVVLTTIKHKDILPLFPDLTAQIEIIVEEQELLSTLLALQMQLLLSLNTLEIEKSLREEIIPEMMKHVKNKSKDLKGNFDLSEDFLNEQLLNPEWEADGASSKLGEKMRALSEMQHKGADIMLGSFKMLKQSYPFFSVAANWFYPYTPTHPEFNGKPALPDTFQQMFTRGMMCESDKYSLHLMFTNMSQMQDAMSQQLSAALGGAGEGNWGNTPATLTQQEELVNAIRMYVQDIYRYFKLFRHLDTQADPFIGDMFFCQLPPFRGVFANEEMQRNLSDFAFKEGFWSYAMELLRTLPESAVNHQKMGYCLSQMGRAEEALEHYEKANLLQEGSTWTLRQLGNGLRKMGRYAEALRYYEELEISQPDDEKLLLALAECYLETKQYSQAFDKLFKVDYLYPNGRIAQRALAWCSFLTGKYDKATDYYNKILQQNPTSADFLNAGHNAWVQGRVVEAIQYYRQSLQIEKSDAPNNKIFEKDRDVLLEKGITELDMALMIDALC